MAITHTKLNPEENKRRPSKHLFEGLSETIRENLRLIHLQSEKPQEKWELTLWETILENQKLSKY